MQKRWLVALWAIVAVACGGKQSTTNKTYFCYNEGQNITSLDPAFANNQPNIWPIGLLYNGLVQLDDSLLVSPCIAKRWTIDSLGQTYTFTLRNDVYFHPNPCFANGKGRAVVAADFVYSFNRISNAETASPGEWVFREVDTLLAPNDTTFIIKLKKPYAPFLQILAMPYCSVVPPEAVAYHKTQFARNPVGTGPFMLKWWAEGTRLVLWKNPKYFEFDSTGHYQLPYLDAVAVNFIPDKQITFLEFLKGNLDMLQGIDAVYKDELLTKRGTLNPKYTKQYTLLRCPQLNTEYMGFLVDNKALKGEESVFADVRIRQALNLAVDREKLVRYLRNNIGTPALGGFVPAGMPGFSGTESYGFRYNPTLAKKLLADAGYPNAQGLPVFTMFTTPNYLEVTEFLQAELAALNIKTKIEVNETATHRKIVANQGMPFFRATWLGDYPDPENYLALFYSPNFAPQGPNYTHFKSPTYDKLFTQALQTTNPTKKLKLYKTLDSIIVAQAPVMPLYYENIVRFVPNNIVGLRVDAMNRLDLRRVKKL